MLPSGDENETASSEIAEMVEASLSDALILADLENVLMTACTLLPVEDRLALGTIFIICPSSISVSDSVLMRGGNWETPFVDRPSVFRRIEMDREGIQLWYLIGDVANQNLLMQAAIDCRTLDVEFLKLTDVVARSIQLVMPSIRG